MSFHDADQSDTLGEPPPRCLPPVGQARDLSEPIVTASEHLGHEAARPVRSIEHPFFSVMLAMNLLGDPGIMHSIDTARRVGQPWSVLTQNGILMAFLSPDGARLTVTNERCKDLSFVLPEQPMPGAAVGGVSQAA